MSDVKKGDHYQIIWLVRRLFRALSHKSNEGTQKLGVSVADRAVMEFLYPDKNLSVPEIAELYKVSRQHIQTTVNNLIENKLAEPKENIRHKRSPLIALTKAGVKRFESVLEGEQQVIEEIFSDISDRNIKITEKTLKTLLENLTR